ncbi:EAL domain-containing protein [Erwinia sp. Eh17-17]|uniref:EAL domain-containing protein n=1 Tax=Erwinia sp. Eh17-17 TaxID=3080330 RepID=UPI003209EB4F
MSAKDIRTAVNTFNYPDKVKKKVVVYASLISFAIVTALFFLSGCIVNEMGMHLRSQDLSLVVKNIDAVIDGVKKDIGDDIQRDVSCSSGKIKILQSKVQKSSYVRSVTLYDAEGNIYCSSSRWDEFIPHRQVSESVRGDIERILKQETSAVTLKIIQGSTRVPGKPAVVIFIPFNGGVMTSAIDGQSVINLLNNFYFGSNYYHAFSVGESVLTSAGVRQRNTLGKSVIFKDSDDYDYRIYEIELNNPVSGWGIFSLMLIFLVAFFFCFTVVKKQLNKIYSRARFIESALKNKHFSYDIQPCFTLAGKQSRGGEVLARWRLDDANVISPGVFIPVAEKHGLVNQIAEYLIADVAEKVASGEILIPAGFCLGFNVYSSHFESLSLVTACEDFFAKTQHKIKLMLELTERQELTLNETVNTVLLRLKTMGVEIAVDDFGTGSSGLRYLYDDSFDCIKIDKIFIEEALLNVRARMVLEASMQLAHRLGKRIVVEGIEKESQITLLKSFPLTGEVIIQGYLWSRPLSLANFTHWLRQEWAAE